MNIRTSFKEIFYNELKNFNISLKSFVFEKTLFTMIRSLRFLIKKFGIKN